MGLRARQKRMKAYDIFGISHFKERLSEILSGSAKQLSGGTISMSNVFKFAGETGAALLLALLALLLFTILGLYMTLNATTGLHISDNYESQLQATYAALAGLNHARALLRGVALDDLLKGPDGAYNNSTSYLAQAKSYHYRNLFPLITAHSLNIFDPSQDVLGIPDDGLISTGSYGGANGTLLIPLTGISQVASNPNGSGIILTSRYFAKVSDNNGEASETAGDAADNPFVDGDGIVIVRSIGVSKTISETTGVTPRFNSVAVFEARYKRLSTWDLGSALVVLGSHVNAVLGGAYTIAGGISPAIATIDVAPNDTVFPDQIMRVAAGSSGSITGGGLSSPSVLEIGGQISSNPDQSLLLDPAYLWDFVHNQAPKMADSFYSGSQSWLNGSAPYLGFYDSTKPWNAPGQDPKITLVDGNLQVDGYFSGGGLLIVTGDLSCSGPYAFNGLVLVIGSGNLTASGSGPGIDGGIFVANLINAGGTISFGTPGISIDRSSRFSSNRESIKMAIGLIPASQISFREIAGSDP
jgi:hypothetical protein